MLLKRKVHHSIGWIINNLRRGFRTLGSERLICWDISLPFSETSTAFRHLLNVLLLSRFNWAIISIFLNKLSSWVYQDKFLTETGSLINFLFSQLFDGKLIFSRNPTELAKTQIHVHLLEKISLLETLFSRVNGCCYGYYNQLCVWGIWRSGLKCD